MSITRLKALVPGSVMGAGAATYYTAGTGIRGLIKAACIVNTTGGALAATIYVVPSGGAADAAHTRISAKNIAAGESYPCPELVNNVVEEGGTIQGLGAGLSFSASGAETTV